MRFVIWTVTMAGRPSTAGVFETVSLALEASLRRLGHEAVRVEGDRVPKPGQPARLIVLAANLLRPDAELPSDVIVYQLEHACAAHMAPDSPYRERLKQVAASGGEVWDFALHNINVLASDGIPAKLCRIGYVPEWKRVPENVEKDIPVLFYGSMNERRHAILWAILKRGIDVHIVDPTAPVYGEGLDKLIARAKVVVNVHFHPECAFEIVRVSYLLANKVLVVSERGVDPALEEPFANDAVLFPEGRETIPGLVEEVLNHYSDYASAQGYLGEKAIQSIPFEAEVARCLGTENP